MSGVPTNRLKRAITLAAAGLMAGAIVRELAKPKTERTWHGRVVGVPYDLRPPTVERVMSSWWAPDDPTIMTPRSYGVGWDINVGRLVALARRR